VAAEGRPGDDAEAVLREACDGEVALDSAARIEHLRVRDGADVAGDPVVAQPLEEVGCLQARDLDLREGGLVEQRGRRAAGDVLGADRGRPEPAGPAPRPQRLVAVRRVRLEPVDTFPAGLLAEDRTELLRARVRR